MRGSYHLGLCLILVVLSTGCQYHRLNTIPANTVRNASCCDQGPDAKINFLALRRTPPEQYVLDKGDTLGIYIQSITGDADTPPPVFFPEGPGEPAVGYPVPVRDDGTISLPLVRPIDVRGMTLGQAEEKIRDEYTVNRQILKAGSDKILVTLMRPRKYNIVVIREDLVDNRQFTYRKNDLYVDESKQGESFSIELDAYKNDVLHALSETGGMPGEGAHNEIIVLRGALNKDGAANQPSIIQAIEQYDSNIITEGSNMVRIPIKASMNEAPVLTEADITLNDGDVVYIEGRQREVFYTGGLLDGGRFPLPRDYEIDVLEAMSMAGGSVSTAAGSNSGAGIRSTTILPATRVVILRRSNNKQCAIEVDLRRALAEPSQRVIVQPGDMIMLEYRPRELAINSIASIIQFGGIFQLFR